MALEERTRMHSRWFTLPILILASGILLAGANKDCSFLSNPDEFMPKTERIRKSNSDLTTRVSAYIYNSLSADQRAAQALNAVTVPRKNFIDRKSTRLNS